MIEAVGRVKFSGFTYENGAFMFTFLLDDEEITLHLTHSIKSNLPEQTVLAIAFNIGMCYLMDLAEITLARRIEVYRSMPDLAFSYWQQLHQEMLLEKCYALQLPTTIKNVEWRLDSSEHDAMGLVTITGTRDHAALCLTGGKESLSILKTLRDKKPMLLFFLDPETNTHRQKVYETVKDSFMTTESISNRKELFAPFEQKYGGLHSGVDMAHLVFSTMLYADICEYVLIGNEYSSNYPNDVYEGSVINHQFVKTLHFAENLNSYIHDYVTKDFTYYSPFFGLYEFKIADLLFQDDSYLDVWTSCNQTTPEINFCSNCFKCAFTYLIARTKKDDAYLSQFFSRNMLEDVSIFKPLMDFVGKKPLDCVGDKTEVWVALEFLLDQGASNAVLDYYNENIRPQIVHEVPAYKQQITSVQRVPIDYPDDIQSIIYDALEK
jgi:hypothetical protein